MTTKPTPVKLPRKMSALITLALADLAKCERSEKYTVDMDRWHEPTFDRTCAVCFAGAVMAKTLDADVTCALNPGNFAGDMDQLMALNFLREGKVWDAAGQLRLSRTDTVAARDFDRLLDDYSDDPKKFRAEMRKLARELKAVGL